MKRLMISLNEKTIQEAKAIAEIEQIPYTVLFRNWIVQRIREYAPADPIKTQTGTTNPTRVASA